MNANVIRSAVFAVFTALTCAIPLSSFAMTDSELQAKLAQRFAGDRTGACVVAAVMEGVNVSRATFCANEKAPRQLDFDTAFEIGSITKTMTAFLVADLVEQGKWKLSDPIAKHLPATAVVPQFEGAPITVAHVVTHTSGLPPVPSKMRSANPNDPYAKLSATDLLESLRDVKLSRAPGSQLEYSNFAMMLLSMAVAQAQGGDFEAALKTKLFTPLGMRTAFINQPPPGSKRAQGYLPSGESTPAWNTATNLAGVGMVKASLNDMVKYAQAQAGLVPSPLTSRMQLTHRVPNGITGQQVAINWFLADVKGKTVLMHDGGTGGFSSSLVIDKAAGRAAVVLSDTSLTNLGGLDQLSLHLLGADLPLAKPRVAQSVPEPLIKALAGDFDLAGLPLKFFARAGKLISQAQGQPEFELGYDSAGDLYPLAFDARLTPVPEADGSIKRVAFFQGGAALEAVRVGTVANATASNPQWVDYAGEYQLAPTFVLRVFEEGGKLKIQGSGQQAIDAVLIAKDKIEVAVVQAVVEFTRDAAGKVVEATLVQGGRRTPGKKK
jgi:CubicO group peptidase (beta-lactamase class C family)